MKPYTERTKIEKYAIIEHAPLDTPYLSELAADPDEMIRSDLAKALAMTPCAKAEAILRQLAEDPDQLVRANAYDSLCWSKSPETLAMLLERAETESDWLARGYAVLSAADILSHTDAEKDTVTERLVRCKQRERNRWTQLCFTSALCRLGRWEYLSELKRAAEKNEHPLCHFAKNSLHDLQKVKQEDENNA